MPPSPGRPHQTDLLLCGHHYRVCRRALAAEGAVVLDTDGAVLPGNIGSVTGDRVLRNKA